VPDTIKGGENKALSIELTPLFTRTQLLSRTVLSHL